MKQPWLVSWRRLYTPPSRRSWSKQHEKFRTRRPLSDPYALHALHPEKEWWRERKEKIPTFLGFPDVAVNEAQGGSLYAEKMDPLTLVLVLERVMSEGVKDFEVVRKLARQAIQISSKLKEPELGFVFYSFAKIDWDDLQLFITLLGRIQRRVDDFTVLDCANVLDGMSNLSYYHADTMERVLGHGELLLRHKGDMDLRELVRFHIAVRNLGCLAEVQESLGKQVMRNDLGAESSVGVGEILLTWGLGSKQNNDVIWKCVRQLVEKAQVFECYMRNSGFSRHYVPPPVSYNFYSRPLIEMSDYPSVYPEFTTNKEESIECNNNSPNDEFVEDIHTPLEMSAYEEPDELPLVTDETTNISSDTIPGVFDPETLCLVSTALARRKITQTRLIRLLKQMTILRAHQLKTYQLALIMSSFARLNVTDRQLFHCFSLAYDQVDKFLLIDEVASCFYGFVRARFFPSSLKNQMIPRLIAEAKFLEKRSLVVTLDACGRMPYCDSTEDKAELYLLSCRLGELMLSRLESILEQLEPSELCAVSRILTELQTENANFLASLSQAAIASLGKMQPQQVAHVLLFLCSQDSNLLGGTIMLENIGKVLDHIKLHWGLGKNSDEIAKVSPSSLVICLRALARCPRWFAGQYESLTKSVSQNLAGTVHRLPPSTLVHLALSADKLLISDTFFLSKLIYHLERCALRNNKRSFEALERLCGVLGLQKFYLKQVER